MNKKYNIRENKFNLIKKYNDFYIDDFKINETINSISIKYKHLDRKYLFENNINIKTAGRIILRRKIGKVIFITLQDIYNNIQLYLSYNFLSKFDFNKYIDIGDIIGVIGILFKTKTKELSINCSNIYLLSKSLKQLPNKFKGLNTEHRSRKRYIDLIYNKKSRETFKLRSEIILEIRKYLSLNDFIEVETSIMQSIPGGATAKPFITKYNSLNSDFYLRISPELYLKKLIVGGFNKIFEIGKCFRNEGISCNHNPEFTILELYNSYVNYLYLIKFVQKMIKNICINIFNTYYIKYNDLILDFYKNFEIITMKDSIYKFNNNIKNLDINDFNSCFSFAKSIKIDINNNDSIGELQFKIFKKTVEKKLIQPTYIVEYPIDISPLSKKNNKNNLIADRFELFIYGLEIANGFSELNDSEDQSNRFKNQINNKNINNKYNFYDKDYINALKYGLPPTSGVGIGIDRLIMLLTNNKNIKDVILFPTIRYKN